MTSGRQISVAVIGAGLAGRSHAAGFRQASTVFGRGLPPIRLATIADANASFADALDTMEIIQAVAQPAAAGGASVPVR